MNAPSLADEIIEAIQLFDDEAGQSLDYQLMADLHAVDSDYPLEPVRVRVTEAQAVTAIRELFSERGLTQNRLAEFGVSDGENGSLIVNLSMLTEKSNQLERSAVQRC